MYDVVVVGGGPGGYTAAIRLAQLGKKAVLVEQDRLGGTCLNRGCIPTKALVKSSRLFREIKQAQRFGIDVTGVAANFAGVLRWKEQVVDNLVRGLEQVVAGNGIEVLRGTARLTGAGSVEVTQDGAVREITAGSVILATGSTSLMPPIPGLDLPGVIDSEAALNLESLLGRMVVVGGGVIGLEFGSIFSAFGVQVTIVEKMPFLLPNTDTEIARRLVPMLRRRGLDVITGAGVQGIEPGDGPELKVHVETKGGPKVIEADKVLVAVGRSPNLKGVVAPGLVLQANPRGIAVDDQMKTSLPGVYAVGDVTGRSMLAHSAAAQGMVAAEAAAGGGGSMADRPVPGVVFCSPEVAGAGLTEDQAKQQGIPVRVAKFPFSANGRAHTLGEAEGLVKLVCGEDGAVLGVHIIGPEAGELIQQGVLAIEAGIKARDLARIIHAHPSLSEAVMEAAHGIDGKFINKL